MKVLVGDIGGTNTRLCILDITKDTKITEQSILVKKDYKSQRYDSLSNIIVSFLDENTFNIEKSVFAIAGPIIDGKCSLTNLDWNISEEKIRKTTEIKNVKLLNDLEAHSYFIPHIEDKDIFIIHKGVRILNKNICLVAPGTGLGEAFLVWDGEKYMTHATEGGHTSFSPENPHEIKLLRFLSKRYNTRISVERVCSGIGIKNIFDYLSCTDEFKISQSLNKELTSGVDPVSYIINFAINNPGESIICDKTLQMFMQILGSECGDFALKTMALSGVYLTGGIPSKIAKTFENEFFINSFLNKGRMKNILDKIPINVIINEKIGIFGAGYYSLSNKV